MKKNDIVKYLIIGIGAILVVLWAGVDVFHFLPDTLTWPMRICVIAAGISMYFVARNKTGGGNKKGKTR